MNPRISTHRFTVPVHGERCSAAIAVVRVGAFSELPQSHAANWLQPGERHRLDRIKVDHARTDFMAGRMAAKLALQLVAPETSHKDWEVKQGLWHQPCPRGPKAGFSVTLTHSDGVGIAVAFDDRWICGIDFEAFNRLDSDSISTQVSGDERAWVRGTDGEEPTKWLFLWTAREAQGKARRSGLLFPESLNPTTNRTPYNHGWKSRFAHTDLLGAQSVTTRDGVLTLVSPLSSLQDGEFAAVFDWLADAFA